MKALADYLSMDEFGNIAREIEARHALFLFDSCFAGTVFEATRSQAQSLPVADEVGKLVGEPVRMFITAGDEKQQVPDTSEFRRSVIRALEGEADIDRDGFVLSSEIGFYVHDQVRKTSRLRPMWGKMNRHGFDRGEVLFAGRPPAAASGGWLPERIRSELAAWREALSKPTIDRFRNFLNLYPDGLFATVAEAAQVDRPESSQGDS